MRTAFVSAGVALAIATASYAQFQITEVRTGSGTSEYVEIKGEPGASLAGVTFLILGDGTNTGETPTRTGVVEWLWHFAKTDVIGPNGYLVLRNPGMSAFTVNPLAKDIAWIPGETPTTETGFEASDNQTYMLVTNYTGTDTFIGRAPNSGAGGQDLDTNDDGVLDVTPWDAIVDSIALKETVGSVPLAGQDWWYSPVGAGPFINRTVVQATTGTVIAAWDFQTTTNGGTAIGASPNTQKVFTANAGTGTLFLDGTNGSSDWSQASQLNAFSGSNLNASQFGLSTVTGGAASLALVNQTANTKSIVFKFSMAEFLGVNVSYATQRTATGFTSQAWAWSTDGISWTDAGTITAIPASFGVRDLSPLSELNGAPEAYLRLTVDGCTSASGNNRLDNVVLLSSPVVETSVVTTYLAPVHIFKMANGSWHVGVASQAPGVALDTPGSANYEVPTVACGSAEAGPCEAAHYLPFCSDSCCCQFVCAADPFCCETRWDAICESKATECAAECSGGGKCVGDYDGNGVVNGGDLGALLAGWGGSDYDLDGNGVVSGSDLGILLANWGACNN